MSKPTTDVIRKVWVEDENAHLELRPYTEAPTALELTTSDPQSMEYFGKVSIIFSKEYARALGEALIAASQD